VQVRGLRHVKRWATLLTWATSDIGAERMRGVLRNVQFLQIGKFINHFGQAIQFIFIQDYLELEQLVHL
jgi:hypothetical protein